MSWKDTYKVWQERTDLEPDLKQELAAMSDDKEIEDAFYGPLSFGTAGMRGLMGPGINRMNVYTVRQATEGLATLMDSLGDDIKKRGVAIGYDSRHNSRKFAHDAARVLGAHGIKVYIYDNLRPTPELSFAVRHMGTYAGIMITASHNPKEYNGYKIYGEDGGQMPPKESDMMTGYIRKIDDIFDIALADEQEMLDNGLETIMGEDVDAAYLANAKGVTVNPELAKEYGKDMKFVFTHYVELAECLVNGHCVKLVLQIMKWNQLKHNQMVTSLVWNILIQNSQKHLFVPLPLVKKLVQMC